MRAPADAGARREVQPRGAGLSGGRLRQTMRRLLIVALNVAGVALIGVAAFLAWNAYNPPAPAIPADAVVIDGPAPEAQLPPPAPVPPAPIARAAGSVPTAAPTAAPAVLPDSNPRPAGTPSAGEVRQAEQDKHDARKTAAELADYRARAFPAAAGTLPDRIIIPAIDVDSTIVEVGTQVTEQDGQLVSEWQVADFAVGFHNTSALPGAPGNTVMTGHNNINGEVFRNLSDLKGGDEIFVLAGGQPYRYVGAQKLLVKEKGVPIEQRLQNAVWIGPTADVRLTLVSCWPYTSNTYRVIIVAKPAG